MLHFQLISACYTVLQMKNSRRSASAVKPVTMKFVRLNYQLLTWKWSSHYSSLSAVFSPLHSVTNKEQYQKCRCNQSSYHVGKLCIAPPWFNTLGNQQNEMRYKGGQRWVHDVCIVHTSVCQKAHVRMNRHQNSEKIKSVVLAVVKLHLPEGIRQLVSRKFYRIIFKNVTIY